MSIAARIRRWLEEDEASLIRQRAQHYLHWAKQEEAKRVALAKMEAKRSYIIQKIRLSRHT